MSQLASKILRLKSQNSGPQDCYQVFYYVENVTTKESFYQENNRDKKKEIVFQHLYLLGMHTVPVLYYKAIEKK